MMAPLVSTDPVTHTLPGAILAGKYRVERILGQGGMGVVVEARHIQLDERVALKFLLPEYAKVTEAAGRFLREARNAVKIKSEHVARVTDVGELESGAPYMVMEYLEGSDLSGVLANTGVLTVPDACDYIIQGCEAIAEAHSYGIIHRDIKPANLFLSKRPDGSGIVKVLDFGISKNSTGVDNLTKTATSMGSALYMSPEQMKSTRSADHRTDIYALGISLYELLVGRQPFYAETLPALCIEIYSGDPTPIRSVRPDIPEGLAQVLERAYARDRANRFQSIAEFVVALGPYAPAHAQQTIDRIGRLGRMPIPDAAAGQSGVFAAPVASAPALAAADAQPIPGPAPGLAAPLPAMAPNAAAPPAPPPPPQQHQVMGGHQIVPGPYSAPMSVRAAASFAQGSSPGLAMVGQPPSGRRGGFAVAVMVLLGLSGMGLGIAFKYGHGPTVAGSGTATAVNVVAPVVTSAPPVASSAPPVDVKPPDPPKTADPVVPSVAPTASATVLPAVDHPTGGRVKPLSSAKPVVKPGLGDLPDSVYDGKKKP
jgi:serine/threonine-protein kinase